MTSDPLRAAMLAGGAVSPEELGSIDHFGDPADELRAALDSVALVDRSALARLRADGPDILGLLHRLSTADVQGLEPGRGSQTVLTSPKGRVVERLFVHALGADGVLLVGGPGSGPRVAGHLERFTFREQIGLTDDTAATRQLALVGPRRAEVLRRIGVEPPEPLGAVRAKLADAALHVLGEDGTSAAGSSLVVSAEHAGRVWTALEETVAEIGGRPAGETAFEAARILQGLPQGGHELTEDYNPLEAGLWDAVSFDKGCYVGQEVVARLRTYDKISRALVGLVFRARDTPAAGSGLFAEAREVGRMTSVIAPPGREHAIGLAYLKRRVLAPGLELRVGAGDDAPVARVVELPFPETA